MNKGKINENSVLSLNSDELAKVSGGCDHREEELGGKIFVVPTSEVERFVPHSGGDDVC